MKKTKIKKGDKVFWTDPDGGQSSGIYNVIDSPDDDPQNEGMFDDDIISISNGTSDAEVFRHEIKKSNKKK